jgi:hypothetical protein
MPRRHAHALGESFASLPAFWNTFVPLYASVSFKPLVVTMQWSARFSPLIREINPKRAAKRITSYVDPKEVERAGRKLESKGAASIRFGVSKTGSGYHGERGDFCLVGGFIDGRKLSLFYRSLELIGGFAYDVVLIDHLAYELEREWKSVTIYATRANSFALRRNSNEKLFPKLQRIFTED